MIQMLDQLHELCVKKTFRKFKTTSFEELVENFTFLGKESQSESAKKVHNLFRQYLTLHDIRHIFEFFNKISTYGVDEYHQAMFKVVKDYDLISAEKDKEIIELKKRVEDLKSVGLFD